MFTQSTLRRLCFTLMGSVLMPTLASAQMYPGTLDPRSQFSSAEVGAVFSTFRDAVGQRRLGSAGPSVRQDSNSLNGEAAPSWGGIASAWGSIDTKQLNGTYSGNSTNLIFGVDTVISDTLVLGLIGGYNRSSVDLPAGQRVKANGFSLGPYFSARLSDSLSLDGFIGFGRPDYDIDGGQFTGEKTFGNLTLTGSVPLARAELSPFISVASVREKLPAFSSAAPFPVVAYGATEIKSFVTTIGTGIHYDAINKGNLTYLPNAGIELDYVRNDDGFGNVDSFTTPRISGGVTIINDAGALNLGANVARTSEGTTTVGASAAYFLQF